MESDKKKSLFVGFFAPSIAWKDKIQTLARSEHRSLSRYLVLTLTEWMQEREMKTRKRRMRPGDRPGAQNKPNSKAVS